ncbi:hypothetical protein SAMN04487968_10470 [Nocardioides terrae]|uniref:Helicase HerA-like C-terminal domain-containing protein n=1 Tax=Nocardioides terrae TaxID=574651 RepID=A0A1I1GT63_9ACTN|nr:helicase HerA-like domain-containing protein [Nocardioides terrae]SFC15009.1 hypothetical protein SAMN04487968_10470 [Nocardioides terrae]
MTETPAAPEPDGRPAETAVAPTEPATAPAEPDNPVVAAVRPGYEFDGTALELGGLMLDAENLSDVHIRIPLGMLNRHGLVAGATGTGKTKTLQLITEQLSANGVPVFAADIKGDLSGLASPGTPSDKLAARAASVGQQWSPKTFPVQYYALGGVGSGIPVRVTVETFGATLLAKVLELNDTQESSLGLVFHYAKNASLPLIDLADLRAVLQYLTSDQGKADLTGLGGLSSATVGVILRELIAFQDQGAEAFFGEPAFDSAEFLAVEGDGRGRVSLLELPNLADRPAIFSTFLMWLLADLFRKLPEVGDPDKPKLVFFFDEAHLLFDGASKEFLDTITRTVRLIRSKGVGVFFVTQSPTDIHEDVLAQLGSRIQHQLRVNTPNDAKALKQTVNTYPTSSYDDLGTVITTLGIGEAIVTVMNERGAPTPVAWTRLRAPESLMAATDPAAIDAAVKASPSYATYATAVNNPSAAESLGSKMAAAQAAERAEAEAKVAAKQAKAPKESRSRPRSHQDDDSTLEKVVKSSAFKSAMNTAARELMRSMFKKR